MDTAQENEYEIARMVQIAANKVKLAELGLLEDVAVLRSHAKATKPTKPCGYLTCIRLPMADALAISPWSVCFQSVTMRLTDVDDRAKSSRSIVLHHIQSRVPGHMVNEPLPQPGVNWLTGRPAPAPYSRRDDVCAARSHSMC